MSKPSTSTTQTSKNILVVDDEPAICWAFERMLKSKGHEVVTASSAEEGLERSRETRPDLIFLDVRLPKRSGIESLPDFVSIHPNQPIVVMTAFGDLDTAVSAVKNGASEYLIKPFSLEDVESITNRLLSTHAVSRENSGIKRNREQPATLVGTSPAMQQIFKQIALVANSDLSVLITGETGTGKELVSEAIHRYSERSSKPYLPIAPVAFNEELIESELFGHTRGAFTGAVEDRTGLFERAEGGTILLDEIGDLPIRIQIKLLRVLEQGQFTRVGDITPRKCNVRIIAATHRDLNEEVRQERFRRDLFYRLNGIHLQLPPLRERSEDIRPLCEYFLKCIDREHQSEKLTPELIHALTQREWPGNIRELRNAIEHAAVIAGTRALMIDDFPESAPPSTQHSPHASPSLDAMVTDWTHQQLADPNANELQTQLFSMLEPALIRTVMQFVKNNRMRAAELLGIHRSTLREKMRSYKINQNEGD